MIQEKNSLLARSKFLLPRLGVNIDHIATLRELRGTPYPDLIDAAKIIESAGGHQITVHLREDRRHIQDADVVGLRKKSGLLLNLEMAVTPAMIKFANKIRPDSICLVPEKRKELTTEGGLDIVKIKKNLSNVISDLRRKKIKVSLFIEPELKLMELSHALGAHSVELHTGKYCNATQGFYGAKSAKIIQTEFKRISECAKRCHELGLHAHAGHGFDYQNVRKIVALELIEEFNIGHSIVCRAVRVGLDQAVREMLSAIQAP